MSPCGSDSSRCVYHFGWCFACGRKNPEGEPLPVHRMKSDDEIDKLKADNAALAKINAEHIQLSANKDLRIAELVHHRDHGGEIDRLENDRRRKYLQRTEDANRYLAARVDEFEYLLTEMNESIEEHGHAAIAKDKAFHLRIKSALSTTCNEVKATQEELADAYEKYL